MGLFFNYNKPGPGVDKDAPKKKGIFRFFEIFGRKIGKLFQLNMLYFLCSLPIFVLLYLYFIPYISGLFSNMPIAKTGISEENLSTYQAMITLFLTVMSVTLYGSGPASCAAAYIERCFVREQHAWMMSDFFGKYKENFKQGMILSVIDIVATVAGFFSIGFYYRQFTATRNNLWFILMILLLLAEFVYSFMHCYIYQLMVTFEDKLTHHIKNAVLLTFSTFPMLLILILVIAVIAYFLYTTFAPMFALILSFLCLLTFLRFPIEFYTSSVIQKKILDGITPDDEDFKEIETKDNNQSGIQQ